LLHPPYYQLSYDLKRRKPTLFYQGKGKEGLLSRLRDYLKGEKVDFSFLSLDLSFLPPFTQKVLTIVRQIPYGVVYSYGEVAEMLGDKKKARAVGQALRKNPFPIIIPCHRVIKGDRTLGGYTGGLRLKRWLLQNEGIEIKGRKVLKWKG